MNNPYLRDLIRRIEKVSQDAGDTFGNLSQEQLNWKPAPDKWSIAQCLDHLIVSNATYFPQFMQVAGGAKQQSFWEKLPLWPFLWGSLLQRSITPEPNYKMAAPPVFLPHHSELPGSIVLEFLDHNQLLIHYLSDLDVVDHRRTIITSPANAIIAYSLEHACRILTNHEERHLRQARRIMELEEFPLFAE